LKSSARSALTEGSDSLTLVLIHPEVKLGYRSRARSAQAKESLSCESERSIEGLLLQVCAGSKEFKHLKCLKICRKECVQGPSLRLEVVKISGGIRPSNLLKDRTGS
jgi:hypothetical protein